MAACPRRPRSSFLGRLRARGGGRSSRHRTGGLAGGHLLGPAAERRVRARHRRRRAAAACRRTRDQHPPVAAPRPLEGCGASLPLPQSRHPGLRWGLRGAGAGGRGWAGRQAEERWARRLRPVAVRLPVEAVRRAQPHARGCRLVQGQALWAGYLPPLIHGWFKAQALWAGYLTPLIHGLRQHLRRAPPDAWACGPSRKD
mmetsp:Transcript_29053/g.92640  ORF Transcript_29053/g.92640 Transcript_29053/m.92640 type:complete len:200 (+) Transcript_29053:1012-1611(+)|eukprot:scaffold3182_cov99-Isochrysis_galbana.AAC.1